MGEGGNLGITSKGRIQLASQGIRLNTDALDNSAGVDLSDHEVNLKILFQQALGEGRITLDQRDAVLEEVRAEVNTMCRYNNWVHSRMISMDKIRSERDISRFKRAIEFLSQEVPFSRQAMHLPDDATLTVRAERDGGLYRPELATLAANAKLHMLQTLAEGSQFDLERLESYLIDYFPESVIKKHRKDVLNHPLGLNIARTMLTNRVIGDAGATLLSEIFVQTGRQPGEIISAYLQASELLSTTELKAQINDIEQDLKSETEYSARLIIENAVEGVTNWLLRRSSPMTADFVTTFNTVLLQLSTLMPLDDAEQCAAESVDLRMANIPRSTAELLAMLCHYEDALDISQVVVSTGESVQVAASALYSVGHGTCLIELIRNSVESKSKSLLDRPARSALRDQLRAQLVSLSCRILNYGNFESHDISDQSLEMLETLQRELAPMVKEGELELSALVIATDRINRHCKNED